MHVAYGLLGRRAPPRGAPSKAFFPCTGPTASLHRWPGPTASAHPVYFALVIHENTKSKSKMAYQESNSQTRGVQRYVFTTKLLKRLCVHYLLNHLNSRSLFQWTLRSTIVIGF
jgi:hypothetical protein